MAERNVKKPYSDKRWYDDVGAKVMLCSYCKHRIPYLTDIDVIRCSAFPDGIPHNILFTAEGERDLSKVCNNGIKFEPKTEGQNGER